MNDVGGSSEPLVEVRIRQGGNQISRDRVFDALRERSAQIEALLDEVGAITKRSMDRLKTSGPRAKEVEVTFGVALSGEAAAVVLKTSAEASLEFRVLFSFEDD